MKNWQERAKDLLTIKDQVCVGFPPRESPQSYSRWFAGVIPNLFEVLELALIEYDSEMSNLKAELAHSKQIVEIQAEFIDDIGDDLHEIDFDLHSVEDDVKSILKYIRKFNPESSLANKETN